MTDATPAPGQPAQASPQDRDNAKSLAQRIDRLAAVLGAERFPAGDRAALKRMVPGSAPPLAFYRLWLRHLGDEMPHSEQTPAWQVLVAGLAAVAPSGHQHGRGFGQALAAGGWHEARLERLLAAGDDGLQPRLAANALRFLAARGQGFDWVQVARLLLSRADAARDAIHRDIATDFYRHQSRPTTPKPKE